MFMRRSIGVSFVAAAFVMALASFMALTAGFVKRLNSLLDLPLGDNSAEHTQ